MFGEGFFIALLKKPWHNHIQHKIATDRTLMTIFLLLSVHMQVLHILIVNKQTYDGSTLYNHWHAQTAEIGYFDPL